MNAVKVVTGKDGNTMAVGMPLWKYFPTPTFKRFDKASIEIYNISKKFIDQAMADMVKMFEWSEYNTSHPPYILQVVI